MKTCTKCNKNKSLEEFSINKTKTDGRNHKCKECHRKYSKLHYQNNKKYYMDKSAKRFVETENWLQEYKQTLKCEKCNEDHPACLDFHHIDPKNKETELANAVKKGWSIWKIQEEIKKCKIFCANCHRKFHWNEKYGS